ncbi:MAG: hypothetical protein PVI30_14515 [Myxococcales bacterium]|jgi:hypothetical protein
MGFLRKLIYPLFGLVVLFGYGYAVRRGIEPFQVSSEKRAIPTGASRQASAGNYRRRPGGVFFFGGFGGK